MSYFQGIRNKLKYYRHIAKSRIKESDLAKYVFASAIYIFISGILLNCFTFAFFNTNFSLISVIGLGYVIFFIRYELVELIRDIRKRK